MAERVWNEQAATPICIKSVCRLGDVSFDFYFCFAGWNEPHPGSTRNKLFFGVDVVLSIRYAVHATVGQDGKSQPSFGHDTQCAIELRNVILPTWTDSGISYAYNYDCNLVSDYLGRNYPTGGR